MDGRKLVAAGGVGPPFSSNRIRRGDRCERKLAIGAVAGFRNPIPIPFTKGDVQALRTADFNGDHHPDILIAHPGKSLEVLINNGSGVFTCPGPGSWTSGGIAVDINGDGKKDIVAIMEHPNDYPVYSYDLVVMLNDGTGKFLQPMYANTRHGDFNGNPLFTIGDVNGDGKPDAVVVWSTSSGPPAGVVFLGNGDGTFAAPSALPIDVYGQPVLIDLDGNLDLFVGNGTSCYHGPSDEDQPIVL
jgi:hypothetical protein